MRSKYKDCSNLWDFEISRRIKPLRRILKQFSIFLYKDFKVRRCCDVECCPRKELENPPKWLSFPVPDKQNEGHYKRFSDVYGHPTSCEDHIPSKLTDIRRVSGEQQVLRNIIQCSY